MTRADHGRLQAPKVPPEETEQLARGGRRARGPDIDERAHRWVRQAARRSPTPQTLAARARHRAVAGDQGGR